MALGWVQKGSLKGPQGDRGIAGKSMRAASVDVGSNTDVSLSVITPNTGVQAGDVIVDARGEGYTVTAVKGDTVHVSNVIDGFSLKGPKGDPGEGSDVPVASATVAGKASFGPDFDVSDAGAVSLYKAIALSYLQGGSANESGATVDDVTLSWDWNKAPSGLTLDGEEVAKVDGAYPKQLKLTGLGLKSDKTWTLVATDARGAKSTKTTSATFQFKAYWGVGAGDAAVDSAFLLGLEGSALTGTRARDFTVTAGAGQHIYYAIPSSLGAPTFFVGGFEGGFSKVKTFEHTNASGGKASYDVYKSTNAGLGRTTVNAK